MMAQIYIGRFVDTKDISAKWGGKDKAAEACGLLDH